MTLAALKKHDWIQKIIALFQQGLSARELSLSITLGALLGVLPLIGIATPIILWLALVLRLNAPLAVFMTYMVSPLHVLLFIPFIRVGELIFSAGNAFASFQEIKLAFQEQGLSIFNDLLLQLGFGITGWVLAAIPISILLFFSLWKLFSLNKSI